MTLGSTGRCGHQIIMSLIDNILCTQLCVCVFVGKSAIRVCVGVYQWECVYVCVCVAF